MAKHHTVEWTESAKSDISEIVNFIAINSNSNAKKILDKIITSSANLAISPELGRVVPELKGLEKSNFRELIISSWRLIYKIELSTAYIMLVIDARRDAKELILKRLAKL
jgi:toxin ParE1/3/4